jgi:hypothetical protein
MALYAAPPFYYPIFDEDKARAGNYQISQPWHDWFLKLGSGSSSTGTDLTALNTQVAALSLRVTALELELASLTANYATQYDQDSSTPTYAYYGRADPGVATSAAAWQIQKLTYAADGDVTIQWADGNDSFDNVWDNRASLSYS